MLAGGASSRMGFSKALMPGPTGEPLVARAVRVAREAGFAVCVVGGGAELDAIARELDVPFVDDARVCSGPLSGLVGLLRHARREPVILVACDMPYVDAGVLRELGSALAGHAIVASRREGRWEPLLSAIATAHVLPIAEERLARGALSLQGLFDAVGAVEHGLDPVGLRDWDTPEDVDAGPLARHPAASDVGAK